MQYWIPVALCSQNGLAVWVPIFLIQVSQFMWWIMSGVYYYSFFQKSKKAEKNWVSYLVLGAHPEQLFFNWLISHAYPSPRPQCGLVYNPFLENERRFGLPSLETQLIFGLCFYVMGHYILAGETPHMYLILAMIFIPATITLSLWVTFNATAWQIFIGAVVGAVIGLRQIIVFEVFVQKGLKIIAKKSTIVKFFMPDE
jgi:hypothetical protein